MKFAKDIDMDRASLFAPIAPDACESCEMAATITSQCKQIAELQRARDAWEDTAKRHCRNEDYYRKELTKLQKEALADRSWPYYDMESDMEMMPLDEVAKIYVRIRPEKLLLSQEARRVHHLLKTEGPKDYRNIAATFGGDWGKTMDGVIELLDAGIIELVDGNYQVKEE